LIAESQEFRVGSTEFGAGHAIDIEELPFFKRVAKISERSLSAKAKQQ
jgi:hypothetical protein